MIEQEAPEMPLSVQADLLGISRSSLYYRRQMPATQEVALKHKIDETFTRWPFYGSRRMAIALQRDGLSVSRPTVQRYMREMGLAGVAPGPNTSQSGPEHTIYAFSGLAEMRLTEIVEAHSNLHHLTGRELSNCVVSKIRGSAPSVTPAEL